MQLMQFREPLGRAHLPVPRGGEPRGAIELLLARAVTRSRRGARGDRRVLALAIEGGGQAGAVSAGMCVALDALGLIDAVDQIYGSSAGALNGSFTASGQAAKAATNYEDATGRWFANPLRLLFGRPAVNLDYLFTEIIRKRKPYDLAALARGPEFYAVTTDIATGQPVALGHFKDFDELLLAVRASCAVPYLAGPAVRYRGIPMTDGSLSESMPYRLALAGGATDVIVLRSRPAARRKAPYPAWAISLLAARAERGIAELVQSRPARYNADAEELARLSTPGASVVQIAPPPDAVHLSQVERSFAKIRAGFAAGTYAVTAALGVPHADILWTPQAYVAVETEASISRFEQLRETMPEALRDALPDSFRDALPETLRDALPGSLREALPESVREALPDTLREAVPDALRDAIGRARDRVVGSSDES